MTKKEVQQRVLKDGKPLDLYLFTWDEETNTFSSEEICLTVDFGHIIGCTFNTAFGCYFNTGSGCIFNTGFCSIFNTGSGCIFNTGSGCIFNTGSDCIFKTGKECMVVRDDIYEVIELKTGQKIKLNSYGVKGFIVIEN